MVDSFESQKLLIFVKVTKKSLQLGLLIGFLVLSSFALRDLLSNETAIRTSHEDKNITTPSFTLCLYADESEIFDQHAMYEGMMGNKQGSHFPFDLRVNLLIHWNDMLTTYDMKNSSILNQYFNVSFEETWAFHCKVYYRQNHNCWPCITFNAPEITADLFVQVCLTEFYNLL